MQYVDQYRIRIIIPDYANQAEKSKHTSNVCKLLEIYH